MCNFKLETWFFPIRYSQDCQEYLSRQLTQTLSNLFDWDRLNRMSRLLGAQTIPKKLCANRVSLFKNWQNWIVLNLELMQAFVQNHLSLLHLSNFSIEGVNKAKNKKLQFQTGWNVEKKQNVTAWILCSQPTSFRYWRNPLPTICGQSYKGSTIINSDSRGVIWGIFKWAMTLES